VGVLEHVEHREIGRDVTPGERGETRRNENELSHRSRAGDAHQDGIARARAPKRYRRLHQRQSEREHQGVMANLGDHFLSSFQWPCFVRASATSRGMYDSSCLARTLAALNRPVPSSAPSATTPCPSRRSAGGTPMNSTGMSLVPSVTVKWTLTPSCR